MAGIAAPAMAGIATGSGFIILMSLMNIQSGIGRYTSGLIDEINPRYNIDNVDRKMAVDIMLQNATVIALLEDRHVIISGIAVMPNGCSFGACARIELWQQDASGKFIPEWAQAFIDYPNQKVIRFEYSDGW